MKNYRKWLKRNGYKWEKNEADYIVELSTKKGVGWLQQSAEMSPKDREFLIYYKIKKIWNPDYARV